MLDDLLFLKEQVRQKVIKEQLPCEKCGSEKDPQWAKPEPGSLDWWDDPGPYFACADCGDYLAKIPRSIPDSWRN